MLPLYERLKRTIDLAVSIPAVVVTSPLLVTIACLVKLDSPGPIFYRGVRSGYQGRPFRIFKFRTMRPDAAQVGGTTTALHDPRVTEVGHFLRKWKLDEVPQLFNVIAGDMSLVGPRPEVPLYTEQYTDEEQAILSVRPGITDLASLQFISLDEIVGTEDADRAYEERVLKRKNRLRLLYVQHRSLLLDTRILLQTASSLLRGKKPTQAEELL